MDEHDEGIGHFLRAENRDVNSRVSFFHFFLNRFNTGEDHKLRSFS